MRKVTTTVMMWDNRSTTDGMMPARSGASNDDGRDGHIPIKGITILMLIFGHIYMSTTLVCMVAITLMYVSHIRMYLYIEVRIVDIN